ncbi:phage baseplate assembly protein V [Neisseria gonorrhoeae]|nr:phage baseplate assembly protein V [Neisseria gonorrhoeae]TJX02414.1 phage baseplate assembly protein V [Neisseria gonorrhoeae]
MEACRKRQKPPRSAITGRFPTSRRDRNDRPPNRQPHQTRHHRRHRPRVRAQHGGITTDWLPYIVPFAGGVSVWRIPSVGEACTILSPAGEPENGVVLCCQASDRYPAPSADPAETVVRFHLLQPQQRRDGIKSRYKPDHRHPPNHHNRTPDRQPNHHRPRAADLPKWHERPRRQPVRAHPPRRLRRYNGKTPMTDAENGRGQDTLAHIAQSIRNILFTRIGTRLMREEYGSFIPDLIDMPAGHAAIALIHQAAVTALARWKPRITVRRIQADTADLAAGKIKLTLDVTLADGGERTYRIK